MKKTNTKKNKKRNLNKLLLLILIIVLVIIAIIISVVYFKTKNTSKETYMDEKYFFSYPEEEIKTIKNCKTSTCEIPKSDDYIQLKLNKSYGVLDEKVEKINSDTLKYYDLINATTTDSDSCSKVKSLYYHEKRLSTDYYNYENDNYISIAVQRTEFNLCTSKVSRSQVEWYMYDKANNKLITQEEFKEIEDILDDEIELKIKEAISNLSEEENIDIAVQDDYSDIVLFYGYGGRIFVSFYVPEISLYYVGNIR